MQSLFTREGDNFLPTEHCASPWGPVTIHGGASSALMVSAMEAFIPATTMQIARITVDLFRPVPMAPLQLRSQVLRDGKRIKLIEVFLSSGGEDLCRAQGLALEKAAITLPEHARSIPAPPAHMARALEDNAVIGINNIATTPGVKFPPGLHNLVPLKPVDLNLGCGKGSAWVALPLDLLAGVANSPLVKVAALADFGNGFAQLYLSPEQGYINADITVNLHRLPEGEWLGIDARTVAQPNGLAMVETVLCDEQGLIGRVSQSSLTMATFRP